MFRFLYVRGQGRESWSVLKTHHSLGFEYWVKSSELPPVGNREPLMVFHQERHYQSSFLGHFGKIIQARLKEKDLKAVKQVWECQFSKTL